MSHPNPSHNEENEYPSDNYKPVRNKAIKKALHKANGGMVGKLKSLIKEPKRDLYQEFKSKHKIK